MIAATVVILAILAIASMITRRWALGWVLAAFAVLTLLGAPNWFWLMAVIAFGLVAAVLKAGHYTRFAQLAGFLALVLAIAMPGISYLAPTATALSSEPESPEDVIESEIAEVREDFYAERGDELAQIQKRLGRIEAKLELVEAGEESESDSDSDHGVETTPVATGGSELQQAAIDYLESQGFEGDEFTFDISWDHPVDAGPGAFGDRLETKEELVAFLNADTHQSRAIRSRMRRQLGAEEAQRAFSGVGYVPVQLTEAAEYRGNTYFVDGQAVYTDSPRPVGAGDVVWLYVASDGSVTEPGNIRADCANVDAAPAPAAPPPADEEKEQPTRRPTPAQPAPEQEPELVRRRPEPTEPPEPDESEPPEPDESECPDDAHFDEDHDRCVKDDQSFDEQQNSEGPPQREPQEVEPPEEEREAAEEAPEEPPTDEERGEAAPVEEEPEPEPEETAPAAPDEGGSPGGDTSPDGEHESNEQSEENQGINDPDNSAGADEPDDSDGDSSSDNTDDESFHEEDPAEGDTGGFGASEVEETEPETATASSLAPSDSVSAMVLMFLTIAMLVRSRRHRFS